MNSELNEYSIKRCLNKIKFALKERGITYSELALKMDLSEVTIKRMLNQSDISLDRLFTLSDICNLSLGELIESSRQNPQSHHLFTDIQDEEFFHFPHLLSYFSKLFYFNESPEKIAKENGLNDVSNYLYLRQLENIGLITLGPRNQVMFNVKPPLGFASNSKVLKQNISKFLQHTSDKVMDTDDEFSKSASYFMRVKPLRLPQHLFEKLSEDLKKTLDKYAELSEDLFINDNSLPDHQITLIGHPLTLEEISNVPIINVTAFSRT